MILGFKLILGLFRVDQWYKNLMIFLPIIFSGLIGDFNALVFTIGGFFCLCLVSSAGYILNDIVDIREDKLNPRKKPIARGDISISFAYLLMCLLLFFGYFFGRMINPYFGLFILGLFCLSASYSVFFKRIGFADIIVISSGFVLRTLAGCFIISYGFKPYIIPTYWLVICVFFLALFLTVSKRNVEVRKLGHEGVVFKKILKYYTPEMTNALMIICTVALVISYSLYSFMSVNKNMIFSLPFSLFVILRYLYLSYTSEIPLNLIKGVKDIQLLLGVVLSFFVTVLVLYI